MLTHTKRDSLVGQVLEIMSTYALTYDGKLAILANDRSNLTEAALLAAEEIELEVREINSLDECDFGRIFQICKHELDIEREREKVLEGEI